MLKFSGNQFPVHTIDWRLTSMHNKCAGSHAIIAEKKLKGGK